MSHENRDELISAYLDDELSAEERIDVEKWLAESAEARQLLDDLRAVSSRMQSLPGHRLDHDLVPVVVRQAEQTVLVGASPRVAAAVASHGGESMKSWWLRGAGWRRLAWPAVAAAAALAILVYNSLEGTVERQVAQTPERAQGPSSLSAPADAPQSVDSFDYQARERQSNLEVGANKDAPTVEGQVDRASRSELKGSTSQDLALKKEKMRDGSVVEPQAAPPQSAAESDHNAVGSRYGASPPALSRRSRSGVQPAVVAEVTSEYLRGGGFERLLDARKVAWQRVPSDDKAAAKEPTNLGTPLNQTLQAVRAQSSRILYSIQATPEQIAEIVAELRKDTGDVKAVHDESSRIAAGRKANVKTEKLEHAYFALEAVTSPEPAAKSAAPAPSEPKP